MASPFLVTPWRTQLTPSFRITHAKGVWVTPDGGPPLWDSASQLMVANLGHAHPMVVGMLQDAVETAGHLVPGVDSPWRDVFIEAMTPLLPSGFGPILLTTGGADAIENAIKVARMATGRSIVLTKNQSYHGATWAALTASGDARKVGLMGLEAPGFASIETANCASCMWGQEPASCQRECLTHLEGVIEDVGANRIAAILLEGESGTSGCIQYPDGYWVAVRALADRYGICLIADEVMSGFGRCGDWFAVSRYGVVPDMVVVAKGLTNGAVPMGAVLMRESLVLPRYQREPLLVGMTYSAHPLGCAAAVASIRGLSPIIHRAKELEGWWGLELQRALGGIEVVTNIRTRGFLGAFDVVDPKTKYPLIPRNGANEWDGHIKNALFEAGVYPLTRWSHVFVAPPVVATLDELRELAHRLQVGMKAVQDRVKT